jgi:hypothetical protein
VNELMTVNQVAAVLKVHPNTVTRRFAKVTGVIDIGTPESPKRHRYRVLRIRKTVLERYLSQNGGRVDVEVPPIRKVRRTDWETRAARELVTLTGQDDEGRKSIARIIRLARMMTFVPESRWDEICLLDEGLEGR